jgi:hypothetical protein
MEEGEGEPDSLALTSAVVDGDEQRVQQLILGSLPPLLLLVLGDPVYPLADKKG